VKHIRQSENIGAARNFDFVQRQATGKYFAWFADDDLCEETFLEALATSR
jgi:Glycosyl transferase family 2